MPAAADAYRVVVRRRGVSPLKVHLLVRAETPRAAGELASFIAERDRGGMFEPAKVVRIARRGSVDPAAFDDL
jgi:hypothetical protein